MKKILLIEDNREISDNIREYLELEDFEVTQVFDGEKGIEKATKQDYDLILLDLMLPEIDGTDIARRVQQKKGTPIIIITARESIQDILSGFELGAVDYMIKPFHLSELHARILVHIGTKTNTGEIRDDSIYHICGIDINTKKHSFLRDGKLLHLTQKEFLIVEKLLENKNRVVSRGEIIEYLWGEESLFSGGDNKLDVYISNIRSKLSKGLIVTVKGVGYRIGDCN